MTNYIIVNDNFMMFGTLVYPKSMLQNNIFYSYQYYVVRLS